jgi:5-oxopent-3-ene-1,2,5-tricarboxylate decarboxylase/2-hydroxyhepta-2,4-diene-1,7-dioate isomerase
MFSGKEHTGTAEGTLLFDEKGDSYAADEVRFLPPVRPSKIIGLVLNYRDHADELGLSPGESPLIFLKPPNTLVGHMENIIYPSGAAYVHYEGELAAVIGRRARKVKASDAADCIRGYTIANDVTARDFITNTFRPPVKAKGFDTFCPIGPWVSSAEDIDIDRGLEITTAVNGVVKQKGNTRMFMHTIGEVVEYLSAFMTLYEDDIILTGTPRGISPIRPGDVVDVDIEGIGRLTNHVATEGSA